MVSMVFYKMLFLNVFLCVPNVVPNIVPSILNPMDKRTKRILKRQHTTKRNIKFVTFAICCCKCGQNSEQVLGKYLILITICSGYLKNQNKKTTNSRYFKNIKIKELLILIFKKREEPFNFDSKFALKLQFQFDLRYPKLDPPILPLPIGEPSNTGFNQCLMSMSISTYNVGIHIETLQFVHINLIHVSRLISLSYTNLVSIITKMFCMDLGMTKFQELYSMWSNACIQDGSKL